MVEGVSGDVDRLRFSRKLRVEFEGDWCYEEVRKETRGCNGSPKDFGTVNVLTVNGRIQYFSKTVCRFVFKSWYLQSNIKLKFLNTKTLLVFCGLNHLKDLFT